MLGSLAILVVADMIPQRSFRRHFAALMNIVDHTNHSLRAAVRSNPWAAAATFIPTMTIAPRRDLHHESQSLPKIATAPWRRRNLPPEPSSTALTFVTRGQSPALYCPRHAMLRSHLVGGGDRIFGGWWMVKIAIFVAIVFARRPHI